MKLEQLQKIAKDYNARTVRDIPRNPVRWELMEMMNYLAEHDDYYTPSYRELRDTLLSLEIDEMSDFFEAFEEEVKDKKFGVEWDYLDHKDGYNNNGKGYTWHEAYEIYQDFASRGKNPVMYEL